MFSLCCDQVEKYFKRMSWLVLIINQFYLHSHLILALDGRKYPFSTLQKHMIHSCTHMHIFGDVQKKTKKIRDRATKQSMWFVELKCTSCMMNQYKCEKRQNVSTKWLIIEITNFHLIEMKFDVQSSFHHISVDCNGCFLCHELTMRFPVASKVSNYLLCLSLTFSLIIVL